MIRRNWIKKLTALMLFVGMGGSTFQLSGCDQDIRSGIISGLNAATDSIVLALTQALFTSLDRQGEDDGLTGGLTS